MKQFEGYVDPELVQFLDYTGPDLSAEIGDEYKDAVIEMVENKDGVFVDSGKGV